MVRCLFHDFAALLVLVQDGKQGSDWVAGAPRFEEGPALSHADGSGTSEDGAPE